MIEYKKKPAEDEITESIIINGIEVGEIGISINTVKKYHARFVVPKTLCKMIHGFGDTKEEAVKSAIKSGEKDVEALLSLIGVLSYAVSEK